MITFNNSPLQASELLSLYRELALRASLAGYTGCSLNNGTRKTNACFTVACFSYVPIISQPPKIYYRSQWDFNCALVTV